MNCDIDSTKLIRVGVGVLVERVGGWRVLIAQRPREAVLGGLWEFPGGKVDKKETVQACVAREFVEELGLEVEVGPGLGVIRHRYEHGEVSLHPFFCRWVGGEAECRGVTQYRWVEPGELGRYAFPAANVGLIEEVERRLGAAGDWGALSGGGGHVD